MFSDVHFNLWGLLTCSVPQELVFCRAWCLSLHFHFHIRCSFLFSCFFFWVLNLNYIQIYWRGKMAFNFSSQLFYVVSWKELSKKLNIYIFLMVATGSTVQNLPQSGQVSAFPLGNPMRCDTGKIFSQIGGDDLWYLVADLTDLLSDMTEILQSRTFLLSITFFSWFQLNLTTTHGHLHVQAVVSA